MLKNANIMESETFQLIALGANVPTEHNFPAQTLADAVAALAATGFAIRAVSRFFRTPCFPAGAGPDYVNAAVAVQSAWSARGILHRLHAIEAEFGRARTQRWGARTLDLDLLAIGGAVLPDEAGYRKWQALDPDLQAKAAPDELILPHPRIQDRGFVLVPLSDIAPNWRHPVLKRTTAQMLSDLAPEQTADIISL
ncbi:MAG: 2-amino-4-hydroxy-6-hydroxymethyldihydropteridine diphosphokinase [Pseudomonadota bacterium]